MKKKKKPLAKKGHRAAQLHHWMRDSLALHSEFSQLKKQFEKFGSEIHKLEERQQDLEIHVNLLTRLLTTLCIEKFGMRVGVLKRLIKRIEKEAIRDSQILHLESLYKLPHAEKKNPSSGPPRQEDPWEDIS